MKLAETKDLTRKNSFLQLSNAVASPPILIHLPTVCRCVMCMMIVSDIREVFDLFDFWDGRDGLVDAAKVGDLLRCIGLNPTNALIKKNGGAEKFGML